MANLRVDKITSTETFETTGSVQFDGSGDYLKAAGSETISAGTGNFTIEGWLYKNAADNGYFFDCRPSTGAAAGNPGMYITDTTLKFFVVDTSSHIETEIELNKWVHIALTKESGVYKLWIDGSLKGIHINSTSVDLVTTTSPILGTRSTLDDTYTLNGFISNFRIVNGKALYTSNFKPPMKELEIVPGTVVLACQSKTDAIREKTGKTITVGGNAVANELTPGLLTPISKAGAGSAITGSVEFDGSGSTAGGYLEVTPDDDLQFLHKCTDSYTVEAWVHKQASTQGTIFDSGGTSNTTIGIVLFGDSGNKLKFRARQALSTLSTSITTGDVMANDMWHHVALTYDKSTVRLFVNGILVGSASYNTESSVDSTQSFKIGAYEYGGTTKDGYFNGHISNFRIVRGTALYTDNFIPPTRELKKVPGTVLLCCQDPDSPLTEATGKTITGYGDLHEATDVEMIANGSFTGGYSTEWEAKNSANLSHASGELTVTSTQNYSGVKVKSDYLPSLVAGRKYVMTIDLKSVTNTIRFGVVSGLTVDNISTAGRHSGVFTASAVTEVFIEKPTGSNSTFVLKSVSIRELNTPNGASNFTPQVGDDRKVTFEGVTKINTDAYFYLPTGDTESRDKGAGTRGISFGGANPSRTNLINYINISTTGNALEFGELLDKINQQASAASSTRGISAGGFGTSPTENEIDTVNYITIASTGDALDFGDLTLARRLLVGCSSQTRGIFAGGYDAPNKYNRMDYVTIASTGNALDFGDMSADGQTPNGRYSSAGYASPTRGVWHGGYGHPAYRNIIDYVTIASTGNTKDFGDSSIANYYMGGCSNSIRGISAGAYNPSPAHQNLIEYTTIATTGNAKDFGDLPQKMATTGACASQIRGVYLGGLVGGAHNNSIVYVTIMTMGNALDFGDLTTVTAYNAGCSNGHGGLG